MHNIAIIGAGNMGSAIAKGIMSSSPAEFKLIVANPHENKLTLLRNKYPQILTTTDNVGAVRDASVVIIAVKPKVLHSVVEQLSTHLFDKIVISVVAGVDTATLCEYFGPSNTYFSVIPNTAIMVGQGMTFIATRNASQEQIGRVEEIFNTMGETAVIDEDLMPSATALCSCGIAYVFKYVQACAQAGVQLGFHPKDATRYAIATILGAAEILRQSDSEPQIEIDRVTTPGGMTIKGINKLEQTGFVSAVIESILEPIRK